VKRKRIHVLLFQDRQVSYILAHVEAMSPDPGCLSDSLLARLQLQLQLGLDFGFCVIHNLSEESEIIGG
jgi:hypothetical protein